jgi:hypothetical protein
MHLAYQNRDVIDNSKNVILTCFFLSGKCDVETGDICSWRIEGGLIKTS